jgi:hypothetical protein
MHAFWKTKHVVFHQTRALSDTIVLLGGPVDELNDWNSFLEIYIYGGNDVQPCPPASITVFLRIRKAYVNSAPIELGVLCILPYGSELDACRGGSAGGCGGWSN